MRAVIAAVLLVGGSAVAAQTSESGTAPYRTEYEDQEIRVLRLVLPPHATTEARQHPDRVVAILTSGGPTLPWSNPVVWQPAGVDGDVNRGDSVYEAVIVEFKGASITGPLPVPTIFQGAAQVQLVNNARAEVRHVVVAPGAVAPNPGCHVHDKPTVYVHLAPGEVTGVTGGSKPVAVARGQITMLVPGQQHFFFGSRSGLVDFLEIRPQGGRSTPQPLSDCR